MAERTGPFVKSSKLRANLLSDVLVIVGSWAALIALFFGLGRAGYGVGLLVPTLGEDQNWVALLHAPTPHEIANGFWNLDGRNPLSPWFYILAKPIIALHGGISILLYVVSLLLGLATYVLLSLMMRGQARWYVLSASVVVAVNQSNAYFDHIIWNFQVALCCTALAISAYLHFLNSERRSVWAYGLSLVLWSVAFQTYTLQSGALIAIAILELQYLSKRGAVGRPVGLIGNARQLVSGFADLAPFGLVFVLFVLGWITATPSSGGFSYQFALDRLLSSVESGLVHPDLLLMFKVLARSHFAVPYAIVGVLFAGGATALIISTDRDAFEAGYARNFVMVIAVVAAISLPTLVLESGGADWPPGSRWRMIYQLTSPILLLSLIAICASIFRLRYARQVALIAVFILMSVSVTFSLAHKERQVALAKSEAMVRQAIQDALSARNLQQKKPCFVVLEIEDSFQWFASESLRAVYMRTWFPGADVDYRVLPAPRYVPSNPTKLAFTADGVVPANGIGKKVPYRQVVLLQASRDQVTRRFELSREDVMAHNGEWRLDVDRIDLK